MSRTFRTSLFTVLSWIIALAAHPQGDLCSNSILVDPGVFTADGPAIGGGATMGDANNADWYSFDPVFPGYITVQSCLDGGSDTRVHVHTGSCGTLTTLGSDDDGCPLGYPPGNSLLANVPVTPGNLYFIEFDDRWSNAGFDWELIFHTCPAPLPPSFTNTDTTLTVDWDPVASGATFTIELGPPGFIPGTGTTVTGIVGTDGPPVTFTGLTEATLYDVYLWIDCGGDPSPNIGPWPMNTAGNPFVPNDDCDNAYPIACGDALTDSTTLAFGDGVADCGTPIDAPGVWYSFAGTGEDVTLSTCGEAAYDTKISVYTAPCASLGCVAGNDDGYKDCGTTSIISFFAQSGVDYFVLVHGYDGGTGTFTLSMTCAPQCTPLLSNDDCAGASTIVPQPIGSCTPLDATNVCAYPTILPNPPCDEYSNIVDVWFTFNTGSAADHTIIITEDSAANLFAAIYETCGDLVPLACHAPIPGPIESTGLDLNTDYFVRVWNDGYADAGTFAICDEANIDDAIFETASAAMLIHPVPASDILWIDGLPNDAREIWVADPQGRIILHRPASNAIDVAHLAAGTYVLQVMGDRSRMSRPFVKE